jgi:hypothetical protein
MRVIHYSELENQVRNDMAALDYNPNDMSDIDAYWTPRLN